MKTNRSILILSALHVFLFVSMVWLSYAAEMRWHVLRDDVVEMGTAVWVIQHLAFSTPLFCGCLALFLALLIGLRSKGKAGAILLITIDSVFLVMMILFGLSCLQLELPVLGWRDQLRYIFQEIGK